MSIGQGTSQSGNAMKTFLHLGFNQSLDGSKVFDGMYAHVAARQTHINTRFAVPGGGGGLRTDHTAFGQTAPRALDKDYVDDLTGRKGGVMTRCAASAHLPEVLPRPVGHRVLATAGLAGADRCLRLPRPGAARRTRASTTTRARSTAVPAAPRASRSCRRATSTRPARWCTSTTLSARCSSRSRTGSCATPSRRRAPCRSIADATLVRPEAAGRSRR